MNAGSNPIQVIKSFSQSQSNLTRMDGNLTQWENNGRIYPNDSVRDSFQSMATELDDATLALKDLQPNKTDLLNNLKRHTLNLGFNAGMTGSMYQQTSTFGSGWSKELDPAIESTRKAIDVASEPGEPSQQAPPNPLKVLKDLSDVQADLTRWDANFTQWQDNGRTYPGSQVSKDLMGVAGNLYDVRDAVRALHPEQTELLKSLQSDIIKVASNAGSTKHMYNNSTSFGSGWDKSFDASIKDVRKAIDVISGS